MKIISQGQTQWTFGLLVMDVRVILLPWTQVFLKINVLNGKKIDALLCNILRQSIDAKTLYNIRAYKTCYTLWNQVKKLYTNNIKRLYQVISSIANLKQLSMDISSYSGRMFSLKDELISIFPKSTNIETSLSKMDRVFIIILLLNLGLDFENIGNRYSQEQLFQTLIRLLLGYFATPPLPLNPCDLRLHRTLM